MSKDVLTQSLEFPNSPNPWKVAIVLEELGLEYDIIRLGPFEVKKKPYTDLNPNGRTPCLVDHRNDGFHLWEVGQPSVTTLKHTCMPYTV